MSPKSRTLPVVTCAKCGETREPALRHGIFCAPCADGLERELEQRLGAARRAGTAQASVFTRNYGRLWSWSIWDGKKNMTRAEEAEWTRRAQTGKLRYCFNLALTTPVCAALFCTDVAAVNGLCRVHNAINEQALADVIAADAALLEALAK